MAYVMVIQDDVMAYVMVIHVQDDVMASQDIRHYV